MNFIYLQVFFELEVPSRLCLKTKKICLLSFFKKKKTESQSNYYLLM